MSHTGSTLQLEKKIDILHNAQLLIVTDDAAYLQMIEQVLQKIPISVDYHTVSCSDCPELAFSEHQYDLILYHYSRSQTAKDSLNQDTRYPIPELTWWYDSSSKVPLILLTEPLGDEVAIACIRSGIQDYVLGDNLDKLPDILEKNLLNVTSQQAHNIQHLLNTIARLRQELMKLEQQNIELQIKENNINQEYFSNLNHELRSPLANILQFARMLKDEIYGSLNSKQSEYISGILTSGNHLSELINDYLDIAKIEANHEELYLEKIPVEEICDASRVMVQGKAKEKDLELIIKIDSDIDFCYADSLRLKQILINLLSNAIKFTETGSVTLQVTTTDKMLLFSIIDTGIGICEEDSAKLFKPFQQINTPLHRKHKGTGLGLALSRKLAQLHGGDITLTSTVGKGSCFTVTIPHSN